MCSKVKETSDFMSPTQNFGFNFRIFSSYLVILFISLSSLICPVCSQETDYYPPKQFFRSPTGSLIREGSNKIFLCQSSSSPSPTYRWLKDGLYITNASEDLYSFKLMDIARTDGGSYRCEANNEKGNSKGSLLSLEAIIEVAYMDNFTDAGQTFNESIEEGKALVIHTPAVESYPPPSFTWKKNGGPPILETEEHHVSLNGTLVLFNTATSDTGTIYKVEGVNGNAAAVFRNGPSHRVIVTAKPVPSPVPLSFIIPPQDKTTNDNDEKAEFECLANGSPMSQVQVSWYRVDNDTATPITDSKKYILSSGEQRTLTVTQIDPSDAGQYRCVVNHTGTNQAITATATLSVNVVPTITNDFPGTRSLDYGQTVILPCDKSGHPTPTTHWYYNAEELLSNRSSYTLFPNGSLMISQLDLIHAGIYQCFVRNDAGEYFKATWLKVNSFPPELITPPTDVSIVEGADARFPCETRGAPKPTITWSKVQTDGTLTSISGPGRFQILDNGMLLIVKTLPTDSGVYMCMAVNEKGSVNASASLSVLVKTQISRPPQDQTIIKGATATFPCGVSHDPNIPVTWQWIHKNPVSGSTIEIMPGGRLVIDADGTLNIVGVLSQDTGNYTCNVISTGGNDTRTVSLKVIELPGAPVITNVTLHPTDVRAVFVSFSPGYTGNTPILRFSIQYKEVSQTQGPGEDISSGWVTKKSNISADARQTTVSGLRPARLYQFKVFAINEVGEGQGSVPSPTPWIEMPQQPPSSPPKGFFGRSATNQSILLFWQPPDEETWNGPLIGYTIRYKPARYPDNTFQHVNVTRLDSLTNPQYELRGLSYYQEYEVQIAAFNAEGVGVYSEVQTIATLEGHPTAPPTNLVLEAMSSTTIKVSWRPPDGQFINGVNLGYKVFAKRLNLTHPETVAVVAHDTNNPTGVQTTLLENLLKYTNYSITVLCYTSQGDGPLTPANIVRTREDVPSEVDSLTFSDIGSTSLTVTWTPPTEINGELRGYTLMYERKNLTITRQNITLPPTNLTYTIVGLNSTTKYTIYVYASTRIGAGPAKSADIESGVPPVLPKPPFNLGITNIQARSVLLQFLPGYDGKTSITMWVVEALEGRTSTVYQDIYEKFDPDTRAITVKNLLPYTYYKLRLIAENIVGRSNESEPTDWFQTLQDAPANPPGNVTVRALNATSLRVSWTPLLTKEWNGVPKGYKIYYRMKGSTNFTLIDLDDGINMDSAILDGLEEWMEYEVQMLAYNKVGNSDRSPITMERTRESVPTSGPEGVTADAISPTSINVTWGEVPKYQQNGMILGYKVQYRSEKEGIPAQLYDVSGNTTHSVNLTGLRKFVTYQIRVLAYTRMGDGTLSVPEIEETTLPDVPGPPVSIWFPSVSYNHATIQWEEPTEPNGIITGYMVSYRVRDSGDAFVNSTNLPPADKSYTVNNTQGQAHYEFRVVARTTTGWGQTATVEVFTMTIRNIPDKPSKPTIQESLVQARSVTISWIAPQFNGYGPLRNYTVQYKTTFSEWTSVQETIMPSVTTYAVTGLSPNTEYIFRVAATNDIGTSEYSIQSNEQKTLEDYPEGPPRFVKVKRLTQTSVRVTWEQPLPFTWNGDLLGYILMYRQEGNDNFMEEIIPFETMQKELDQLVKFINYEFVVKAFNSIGSGPASLPVTVYVGEAAPTAAPLNIVTTATNSTEITVSWLPPPIDTQNGALSGYKIFYWISSQPQSTAKQIIVREENVVLKDLEIYTEYSVTVQAYNLAGEGPRSDEHRNRTLEGLPERPESISFWNITYTSLDVMWVPPSKPNGQIVSYDLSYEEKAGDNLKIVKFNISGDINHKRISNLVPDTEYLFSVSARTKIGQGLNSNRTTRTGPQYGSPGRPTVPIVEDKTTEQIIMLVWKNGNPGISPIYLHVVQSKTEDSAMWVTILQIQGNETQAEISLTKLNPDNEYRFRVYAMNTYGISYYSEASEIYRTPRPEIIEPEEPFHYQPWFLVIVALVGCIVILVVISLLCLVSRRGSSKNKKPSNSTSMSNLAPSTAEPEDGGFTNFDTATRQSTHSRRNNKFAGIRNGNVNGIYARSPPRPSPASVAYSDDDGASVAKAPLPDDDDDDTSSSCTEKPSQAGDSTDPSEPESDTDSIDPPLPPPPSSPPPPPFTSYNRQNYHDPLPPSLPTISNSWQQQPQNNSFNAYQYTDSEAESSHYAYSLNGGQIVLNNTAGSRAPLPGFSSFV